LPRPLALLGVIRRRLILGHQQVGVRTDTSDQVAQESVPSIVPNVTVLLEVIVWPRAPGLPAVISVPQATMTELSSAKMGFLAVRVTCLVLQLVLNLTARGMADVWILDPVCLLRFFRP